MNAIKTALYRHYNSTSELLYVGISLSATYRFKQHQASAQWVTDAVRMETEWFDTRNEAELAEINAIKNEKPKFNIAHNKNNTVSEPVEDKNGHCAVYTCISHDTCDMFSFFYSIIFIRKPPRCPKCGGKTVFDCIYDESCYQPKYELTQKQEDLLINNREKEESALLYQKNKKLKKEHITREYIEKHARPGESWADATKRLSHVDRQARHVI